MTNNNLHKHFFIFFFLTIFLGCSKPDTSQLIDKALEAEHRTPSYIQRDKYRHPKETLLFFGLDPEQSIIEITPGYGWYTEILAPLVRNKGQYTYTSLKLHEKINPYFVKLERAFKGKMEKNPDIYDQLRWVHFDPKQPEFAPNGPVDTILTFRNVHNWAKAGSAEAMFTGFAKALKPGGTLGVVEHRAKVGTPLEKQIESGYMTEDYVVRMAKDAGFRLDAKSEINANLNDTADHPKGVWNLLPSLRGVEDDDKANIISIGESDRMTLRFIKE
ncbi:methyltransferase [Methylophilaceae bacterium]|nr:methyltransferase [Methylophilaceae bacterium]